jgi:CHAT domain-containing protein
MEIQGLVEQFLSDHIPSELLSTPLPDEAATAVVERLKQEADRYWLIDPNHSLELAERIVAIGQVRTDARQTALGLMARGDALKFLGQMEEAWDEIDRAGYLFQTSGDEIGWARTRIGRLYLGVKLNRVEETLSEVERARAIFLRYGEHEKLMRLAMNTALAYTWLGNSDEALRLYFSALPIAETLGEVGRQFISQIYLNIGLTYDTLGDFRQAMLYYERSREYISALSEVRNYALLEINMAYIARAQGKYPHALNLLYNVLAQVEEKLPWETTVAKRDVLECYLELNRYHEASELAQQVVANYRTFNSPYDLACALLHQATAEAAIANYVGAKAAIDEAAIIFNSLGAKSWVASSQLLRGQIALKEGDVATAQREASAAVESFKAIGQQVNYAKASLLQGQALMAMTNDSAAARAAVYALRVAQQYNVPSLRYGAHLLLGQIDERLQGKRAVHHYRAAVATVERVQRELSITLRPGFLEEKGEALRALIAFYLRNGQSGNAFETLERAKSQVLLGYLTNREQLHWLQKDARGLVLMDELNRLREEHQWFYRLAHEPIRDPEHPRSIRPEQALVEVAARERRMRAITEQLYLHGEEGRQVNPAPTPSLKVVQSIVSQDTLLVEFYNNGTQLWAFLLDGQNIAVHCLPVTVDRLNQLLAQLQINIAAALVADPLTMNARRLTPSAQRILQRLYSMLIEPLRLHSDRRQRLVIIPYGALHYLPFHLLYDGSEYLIEQFEIVILPASGLATRSTIRQKPGALILAHSWDGRLPHTLSEAEIVKELFGGELYTEEMAQRSVLQIAPSQILHIATHGEHRLDQPDLSFLQLADGQLYTDDLLQQNLSYELVTLSGCETGRANVSGGDELIGIGRGFLYGGAAALLVSMWKVVDSSTTNFMKGMYQALHTGASKATALRQAQLEMLAQDRQLHPAFWGAFQLIGDPQPLSKWEVKS